VQNPVLWDRPRYWWNCWRRSRETCGKRLRRPHLTCLTCWIRRMHSGTMPVNLRCKEIRLLVWMYRPGARWKKHLIKPLMSILETLVR